MRKFFIASIAAAGITALPAYAQGMDGAASTAPGDPATTTAPADPLGAARPSADAPTQAEKKAKRKLNRSAASADSGEAPAGASRDGTSETPAANAPNTATPETNGTPAAPTN